MYIARFSQGARSGVWSGASLPQYVQRPMSRVQTQSPIPVVSERRYQVVKGPRRVPQIQMGCSNF
jgi:hypothetical protein